MVVLVILAAAGMTAAIHADVVANGLGEHVGFLPVRHDNSTLITAAAAMAAGHGSYPSYGDSVPLGYAPPFVPLLVPIAIIPYALSGLVSAVLCVVLTVAALAAWARRDGALPPWFLAVLLTLPVISLIQIEQVVSALGLAAITVAVLAQRRGRWWLAGALLGVALVRTANMLPIAAMFVVVAWNRARVQAALFGGVASVLVPLCAIATVWDPSWVPHYIHNLGLYPVVGPVRVIRDHFGVAGAILMQVAPVLVAALLALRNRGGDISLDGAAIALAVAVPAAVPASFYPAVFALPAIIRTAMRPGLVSVVWIAAIAPWLIVLAFTPTPLNTAPPGMLFELTLVYLVLVAGIFPLFRREVSTIAA